MSNARELIFLEKWSDKKANIAAAAAARPSDGIGAFPAIPVSPTSPKATKFCCCPNRRRYHIKQPKSISTFNARNIFIDNDFHFIDELEHNDTSKAAPPTTANRRKPPQHPANKRCYASVADEASDADDAPADVAADRRECARMCNDSLMPMPKPTTTQSRARDKDKEAVNNSDCDNDYGNLNGDNERDENRINFEKTRGRTDPQQSEPPHKGAPPDDANAEHRHENEPTEQQQCEQAHRQSMSLIDTPPNDCNCDSLPSEQGSSSNTSNRKSNHNKSEQETQRLHSKATNLSSDPLDTTTTTLSPSTTTTTTTTTSKMTITTTTNVANRKRSECEPSEATNTAASNSSPPSEATARPKTLPLKPSLPLTRPPASSLKTVIKTTMVKRSPSTDATPTATPTTPLTPSTPTRPPTLLTIDTKSAAAMADAADAPPTPLTVKERIAALVADNEQSNRISGFNVVPQRNRNQCMNTTMTTTTTTPSTTTSAIKSPTSPVIGRKFDNTTETIPPHDAQADAARTPSTNDIPETPRNAFGNTSSSSSSNGTDDNANFALTSPTSLGKALNGVVAACATMPRRRLDNSPAKTATAEATSPQRSADRAGRKLSDLDNLDLALQQQQVHHAEDDEDPYIELQEYLEKVKHEINEAFESHKLQQRMLQHQSPPDGSASLGDGGCGAAGDHDELANSRESDSQANSIDGQQPAAGSNAVQAGWAASHGSGNKLPASRRVSCGSLTTEISCQRRDISNGHPLECDTNQQAHQQQQPHRLAQQQQQLNSADRLAFGGSTMSCKPASIGAVTTNLRPQSPPPVHGLGQRQRSSSSSDYEIPSSLQRSHSKPRHMSIGGEATDSSSASEDVNIWANNFLRDLDNLMAADKPSAGCSSPLSKTSPLLLSAAASAALHSRHSKHPERTESHGGALSEAKVVLKPAKHATIPLQSFNLDRGRIDNAGHQHQSSANNSSNNATPVAYMRTLSAPTAYHHHQQQQQQHHQQQQQHLGNWHTATNYIHECLAASGVVGKNNRNSLAAFNAGPLGDRGEPDATGPSHPAAAATPTTTTVLKIEEIAAMAEKQKKRQHRAAAAATETAASLTNGGDKNMLVASPIPNRERINHVMTKSPPSLLGLPAKGGAGGAGSSSGSSPSSGRTPSSYLLNGNDATKKGSTSTIWTSEESILRSVGAADEDNNSTSSSACEEASGVLSSSKSGISLDSSGLDNDNNESGIGTATPPKDMSYWKSALHDNESLSGKSKFLKGGSVASSDDPDLLEVLSLYDEPHGGGDDDATQRGVAAGDDEDADEGHDEFETVQYCDCEYADGDGNGSRRDSSSGAQKTSTNEVVLRRRHVGPSSVGGAYPSPGRVQKNRSHSLDPSAHHLYHMHVHAAAATPPLHGGLGRKLHPHQHQRASKERAQLSLALRQEPFQSLLAPTRFQELPSPSSASLHSGHESLGIQELTTKSNSAPLLLKQEKKRDDFAGQNLTLRYSRSQSDRYLAEIEAVEACKWLRAAGFPQYAQMYEDHQFPLELANVAKDHTNLENDQLQSLYRRLCVLNRCASMRVDQKAQTPQKEDSDDENFALSENWTFQPHIRRWSRIGEAGLEIPGVGKLNADKTESSSKESSPDRLEDDSYDLSGAGLSLGLPGLAVVSGSGGDSADSGALNESTDSSSVRLRRTGSERLKDGAKAFLRRVESIKSRRRKRQNREGIVISGPQALDLSQLGQRSSVRKPDAVYSTPPSPSAVSPMHTFPKMPLFGNELKVPSNSENFLSPNRISPKRTPTTPRSMRASPLHFLPNPMPHLREGKSDDSSSYYSDSQESSTGGRLTLRKMPSKTRRLLQRTGKVDDIGAHSDSECHHGRKLLIKDANSNTTEVKVKKLTRGGSLNLGKDLKKRDGFRTTSFRSRSTTRKEPKADDSEHAKRNPVVRWHSFQMEERPHMIFRKCFARVDAASQDDGIPFAAMSAGQLQIIRKLALVILTGYMERYCPTHRTGWNWELPKFIKKIKMPDYRDKKVFGVPLLLILQRTGQTLPVAVRSAFRWLQLNALDQIGIFRKSGVKSRIIKLKELIENSESTVECMDVFDTQQAYDVADMLKQYFRDLPESLLTTKMSETFAAIFQHLPPEVRLDAVQCAVLLLPDENREILLALLEFLTLVAGNSQLNQMTSNNLAVCLAPSLFHTSISTGTASVSASPRRRGKGAGVPDVKELSEAKAAHECLSFMIDNYKTIFTASKEKIAKCNFGYMEESKPVPLEALGEGIQFHNWRGYLYECTSATIKEGRERTRGWITVASTDSNVEIAYKKVGDGHPLRLWRCITEVEGPPKDVLDYIVLQRASWDSNLLQSQTVKKLDEHTEIFQYALDGQVTTDFCVLRSWQTDLPRGACVIVETSIDHAKAKSLYGAVRGVVLASRYLIEPCGSGRSRVMHLARVDIKGKTPEWYNKSYGHICSHYLSRIRIAFKNVTEGPESKV